MKKLLHYSWKILKFSLKALSLLFIIYIGYLNIRLYYQPKFSDEGYNESVYHQLHYLEAALDDGAAKNMQQLYPEGYLFTHLLYGLAWANWAAKLPENSAK